MKKILSLCLTFALLLSLSAGLGSATAATADEWFACSPSSDAFGDLWVGDVVCFESQEYYPEYDASWNITGGAPAAGNTMTVVSGDNVQIVDLDFGEGNYAKALQFTKAGAAQVTVQETHANTGETQEKTFSFTVADRPQDKPVTVEHNLPQEIKLKIGDNIQKAAVLVTPKTLAFQNLNYGVETDIDASWNVSDVFLIYGGRGGWGYGTNGRTYAVNWAVQCGALYEDGYAFRAGSTTLSCSYRDALIDGNVCTLSVEEPVVQTNAPATATVGSSMTLTTALTNTALQNMKTAEYEDKSHYDEFGDYNYWGRKLNPVAFKPSVTVVEGKDCVAQSKQDYSNTLSSSEQLTFKKAGTVKLKVTYAQITTNRDLVRQYKWDPEKQESVEVPNDRRYNPEKIITIRVRGNGVATVDGKTVLYKNDTQVIGTKLATVGGTTYALKAGVVQQASKKVGQKLVKLGKKSYIVNTKGAVQKSKSAKTGKLVKVGKKRYIVNKTGLVQTAKKKYLLVKAGKKRYIVNKSGVVQTGKKKIKIGKVVYKTDKTGAAKKRK